MNELPKRKPNRLKNYDYSQNGAYFVTVCTKDRHEMFGEIINGQPVLNEYGLIVKQEIENISNIRKECVVEKFVVMPNHIHLIVQIVGDDGDRPVRDGNRPAVSRPNNIKLADCIIQQMDCAKQRADFHPPLRKSVSNMVQGLKGAVTRQIGFSLWQRSFHDHIIHNEKDYIRIAEYIENNPANWSKDIHRGANV